MQNHQALAPPDPRRLRHPRIPAQALSRLIASAGALLALTLSLPAAPSAPPLEKRWLYLNASGHFAEAAGVDEDIALLRRAASAGYNGAILEDINLGFPEWMPGAYTDQVRRLAAAAAEAGIELVPQVAIPYGGRVVRGDPNLAEGLPVEGARFVARAGRLELEPDTPTPQPDGWVAVQPRRLYRVQASTPVRVTDPAGRRLAYPRPEATEVLFNSADNRRVRVQGTGLVVREEGMVNILRRAGTPFRVRAENGRTYEEGRDFEPVVDPLVEAVRTTGRFDALHPAPEVRLTPGTRIRDGETVRAGWYHAGLIFQNGMDQVFGCLSEPELVAIWERQARLVTELLKPRGFLIGHDELRVLNRCDRCARRRLSPGRMVAENARQAVAIVRRARPGAVVYAWSDMFSPHENAVDEYYLVRGSLQGAGEGVDREVTILNWSHRLESFAWFAGRRHRQILAGYYDGEEPRIESWFPRVQAETSLHGVMYTTWKGDYTQLEPFALTAWGAASAGQATEAQRPPSGAGVGHECLGINSRTTRLTSGTPGSTASRQDLEPGLHRLAAITACGKAASMPTIGYRSVGRSNALRWRDRDPAPSTGVSPRPNSTEACPPAPASRWRSTPVALKLARPAGKCPAPCWSWRSPPTPRSTRPKSAA